MKDKSLGVLIIIFSLLFGFAYFIWAFASFLGPAISNWMTPAISEWAYKLPVIVGVYTLLVIILWIGYTMATTPPPLPLEKPLEIEREEASAVKDETK